MNPASRVFSSWDLFSSIYSYIRPEWVNPMFPSVEGALLDGREDLLETEFTPLFRRMVGKILLDGNPYLPMKTYSFEDPSQLADFVDLYTTNYTVYKDQCCFSAILGYVTTPFLLNTRYCNPIPPKSSHRHRMDVGHRIIFTECCKSNDLPRIREMIIAIYPTGLSYSFGALYDIWEQQSTQHIEVLCIALKTELELLELNDERKEDDYQFQQRNFRNIQYIDNVLSCILDEIAINNTYHNQISVVSWLELYRIRFDYLRLGMPTGVSDEYASILLYSNIGSIDFFAKYQIIDPLLDCLYAIETISVRELLTLIRIRDQTPYSNHIFRIYHTLHKCIPLCVNTPHHKRLQEVCHLLDTISDSPKIDDE